MRACLAATLSVRQRWNLNVPVRAGQLQGPGSYLLAASLQQCLIDKRHLGFNRSLSQELLDIEMGRKASEAFSPEMKTMEDIYNDQFEEVKLILEKQNSFSKETIHRAAMDFYNHLGLNEYYFTTSKPENIAGHIHCIIAANMLNRFAPSDFFPLIHQKDDKEVVVISRASLHNREASQNYAVEKMLEKEYLHFDGSGVAWRLQGYRSVGSVFDDPARPEQRMRTCFLQKPVYATTSVNPNETDLAKLVDVEFWKHKESTATSRIFSALNEAVVNDPSGLKLQVHKEQRNGGQLFRLDFAFRRNVGQQNFYSNLGDIITTYGMFSRQKHVEPLSNGVAVLTCFVQETDEDGSEFSHMSLTERVDAVIQSAYMRYVLPVSRYNALSLSRTLHTLEGAYCHAVAKFTFQFSQSVGPAFSKIARVLENSKDVSNQELYEVRSRLKHSPFSEEAIYRTVEAFPEIVKRLFQEFRENNCKLFERDDMQFREDSTLAEAICRLDDHEAPAIFEWFMKFNRCILKTNFFKNDRLALAFRCDPSFLPDSDFEHKPFGVVFFTGNGFRGFHSRFADVARGGVRVVQSMSPTAFHVNSQRAFDEVYKLSRTQNFKNKDIPEGGSKGIILLDMTRTKEEVDQLTRTSFYRYIDSFLDILLPNGDVVDRYGKPEVCFLGPDEHTGTGGLMDWASTHAKARGAWFWRAFTTGKATTVGGIPHDVFGMTTSSVETFVKGTLEKMGVKEEETTKCMTGGPDGDLGSNSILMSKTKLTSIVDGSGVLADPQGLDREELIRLVNLRNAGEQTCVMFFNKAKLSPEGYMVSLSDRDVALPNGTMVKNGLEFRNSFHLNPLSSAFLFNPNGGRPESITPFNYEQLLNADGSSRFKAIIEGANVFITEDARIALEKAGAILFKDASTNKGGVTSSSCEVMAALIMSNEQFEKNMCVKDPKNPTAFYKTYVEQVKSHIVENAQLEFEILWKENERTGIPRSTLTDMLSGKIMKLKTEILKSNLLWDDETLRSSTLHLAIPSVLMPGLVSFATMQTRVPESYLRAVFASYLASRFYYSNGLDISTFSFMEFLQEMKAPGLFRSSTVVSAKDTSAMLP